MSLSPFISLSALNAYVNNYDPYNPTNPYGWGYIYAFGAHATYWGPYELAYQYNSDEIALGFDPVALTDQTVTDIIPDIYRRSALRFQVGGTHISTDNQFLMVFGLISDTVATAQFFIGTDFVRAEEIAGPHQVAVLMDVPGDDVPTYVHVRLAADYYGAKLRFTGLDVYLL